MILGSITASSILGAAEVTLTNEGKLSGDFLGWDDKSILTLRSPFSEQILRLDASKVKKVNFVTDSQRVDLPDQRIYLVNGDVIAAKIEEMDENRMRVVSPYLGEMEILRVMVDAIQLGIAPVKAVTTEMGTSHDWSIAEGGQDNWLLKNGVMLSSGQGTVARTFELPEKYTIKYDIKWSGQPNLSMYFGDPLKQENDRTDRYLLQLGIGGLVVKREASEGERIGSIAISNRRPDMYEGSRMSIELRVDQKSGRMQLFIDGKLQGKFKDDRKVLPKGNGVKFVSNAQGNTKHFISNFKISEWDDRVDRHRSEERGEDGQDSLIGRNGERFGGRLESVKNGEKAKIFRFKSDYNKDPIDLPESEVSTIFFARSKESNQNDHPEGMVIHTAGGGILAFGSCEFGDNRIAIMHPILGRLEVNKEFVERMELREVPKAKLIKKLR